MAWPAAGFFTGFATQGQLRQALDDTIARARMDVGGDAVQSQTVASGLIAPSAGAIRLFGEGAAADVLDAIDVDAYQEGQLIELRIGDENQPITVQHDATPAANSIVTLDGFDYAMTSLSQRLVLERSGTYWTETERRGRELRRIFGASGQPDYQAGYESHPSETWEASFWKDETGQVHFTGRVRRTAGAATFQQVLDALPVGFRPAFQVRVPCRGAIDGTATLVELYMTGDGRLFWGSLGASVTASVDLYLDSLTYRAEA